MNLYLVCDRNYDWECFAFDRTRNCAKSAVAKHFEQDYIDVRCTTLERGINVLAPVVVDSEEHPMYPVVIDLGYHYASEEELWEEW